jgi:hypothetical protein
MNTERSDHYIDGIALQLSEDVHGASGDFDDLQIRTRLMEAIVARCNYHIYGHSGIYEDFIQMSVEEHADKPALTLRQAANLIFGVWKYMEESEWRRVVAEIAAETAASSTSNPV